MQPPITIYSSPFCGYCLAAKRLLRSKGVEFDDIDVFLDADKRSEMVALSGRSTVPQIFIGDRHVGGYDDLRALDRRGELDPLLDGAQPTPTLQGD